MTQPSLSTSCGRLSYVTALLHFKMVRRTRLHELIQTLEEVAVREKVTEALQLCLARKP